MDKEKRFVVQYAIKNYNGLTIEKKTYIRYDKDLQAVKNIVPRLFEIKEQKLPTGNRIELLSIKER